MSILLSRIIYIVYKMSTARDSFSNNIKNSQVVKEGRKKLIVLYTLFTFLFKYTFFTFCLYFLSFLWSSCIIVSSCCCLHFFLHIFFYFTFFSLLTCAAGALCLLKIHAYWLYFFTFLCKIVLRKFYLHAIVSKCVLLYCKLFKF